MPKLINRYGVVDAKTGTDGWIEYTGDANAIPMGAKVLLPLTEFRAHRNRVGVARVFDPAIGASLGIIDAVTVN